MRRHVFLLLGLLVVSCAGCGQDNSSNTAKPSPQGISVATTNVPLAYFVKRIGGEQVELIQLDPRPQKSAQLLADLARAQQANLIFIPGDGLKPNLDHLSLPAAKIVDTSHGFRDQLLTVGPTAGHQHGPSGDQIPKEFVSTTWLDPRLAVAQAKCVLQYLVELQPQQASHLQSNFEKLRDELLAIDDQLVQVIAEAENAQFLATDPAYRYLAARCSLNIKEWPFNTKQDSGEAWQELQRLVDSGAAKTLLLTPAPLPDELLHKLNETEITPVVFELGDHREQGRDLVEKLQTNLARLKSACQTAR